MIMQPNNKKHDKTMWRFHYSDVTMSGMASQIADVSIICSKVCSSADKKKTSKLQATGLWVEFTADRWIPRTKGQ